MKAEIITIGDEILIGQIVDTNSAWMGVKLNEVGVQVVQITTVADREADILLALTLASGRADLILVTGGLGPTKDDVTKQALCTYFRSGLRRDPEVLAHVEGIFRRSGKPILEVNRQQADVLDKADVLFNPLGTAPGMWIAHQHKHYAIMPGVPFEMKHLMESQVLPRLQFFRGRPAIWHHTMLIAGIGESFLAQKLEGIEASLPPNIRLAYLPALGAVRVRLSAAGGDANVVRQKVSYYAGKIREASGIHFIANGDVTLEEALFAKLRSIGRTVSVAESCTGGYLAHLITSVPGSSEIFPGGCIAYSNQVKQSMLAVPESVLETQGAVSEAVVQAMAEGAKNKFSSDYAVAISGIAGPGGGSEEKPVGTVWIAVAGPDAQIRTRLAQFGNDRKLNIQRAANAALYELLCLID